MVKKAGLVPTAPDKARTSATWCAPSSPAPSTCQCSVAHTRTVRTLFSVAVVALLPALALAQPCSPCTLPLVSAEGLSDEQLTTVLAGRWLELAAHAGWHFLLKPDGTVGGPKPGLESGRDDSVVKSARWSVTQGVATVTVDWGDDDPVVVTIKPQWYSKQALVGITQWKSDAPRLVTWTEQKLLDFRYHVYVPAPPMQLVPGQASLKDLDAMAVRHRLKFLGAPAKTPRTRPEIWFQEGHEALAWQTAHEFSKELGWVRPKKWEWGGPFAVIVIAAPEKVQRPIEVVHAIDTRCAEAPCREDTPETKALRAVLGERLAVILPRDRSMNEPGVYGVHERTAEVQQWADGLFPGERVRQWSPLRCQPGCDAMIVFPMKKAPAR